MSPLKLQTADIVVCARCTNEGELRHEARRKGWAIMLSAWNGDSHEIAFCPTCAAAFRRFVIGVHLTDEEPAEGGP